MVEGRCIKERGQFILYNQFTITAFTEKKAKKNTVNRLI